MDRVHRAMSIAVSPTSMGGGEGKGGGESFRRVKVRREAFRVKVNNESGGRIV